MWRDFDQTEFFDDNNANGHGLDDSGFIFVPDRFAMGVSILNVGFSISGVKMEQISVIFMFIFMDVVR